MTGVSPQKYGELLLLMLPKVIETEEEYQRHMAQLEALAARRDRSEEESQLMELLSVLVERYEDKVAPLPAATPDQMLRHFMEQHDLRQRDLLPVFHTRGAVSNAVNGRRGISKVQAKKLAEIFHTSAEHFI